MYFLTNKEGTYIFYHNASSWKYSTIKLAVLGLIYYSFAHHTHFILALLKDSSVFMQIQNRIF